MWSLSTAIHARAFDCTLNLCFGEASVGVIAFHSQQTSYLDFSKMDRRWATLSDWDTSNPSIESYITSIGSLSGEPLYLIHKSSAQCAAR